MNVLFGGAVGDMTERLMESHKKRRRGLIADTERAFEMAELALFKLDAAPPKGQASLKALKREVLKILRGSGGVCTKCGTSTKTMRSR